ncbi:AAA family ATPase [Micromonospora sp. NPDC006766]|uniref:AAA family ATPase n=1 Tax=Micromonospora sp. NPDC006766 TaxID=3154778 RepID=UPI0033FC8431
MTKEVILVNGVPGSGKTTLGDGVAGHLGIPVLSKDRIKEGLADATAHPALEAMLGMAAMEVIWTLAAALPGPVVVDSWWFRPRDLHHALKGIKAAGAETTVEVWCDVPISLAKERYAGRVRHGIHHDDRDMATEWAAWAAQAAPLAIGQVIRVDTTAPVNIPQLAAHIANAMGASVAAEV